MSDSSSAGNGQPSDDLRAAIERIAIKNSRIKIAKVDDEDMLNFDLGFDSHGVLNLLLDVEDEFGFEVPPEKVPELIGVPFRELVAMVRSKVGGEGTERGASA